MTATPPTLTPVTEDIPAGATNWLQKITDRWVAVGDNFDEVLAYAQAVASQSAQSVNGHAPDGTGNVTVPIPGAANIQVFLASGTWTKPAGCTTVFTIAVGGGQGGGSGPQSNASGSGSVGATAGTLTPAAPGGYATRLLAAALLPSTVSVSVGAAGAGAAAVNATGNASSGVTGSTGGTSGFGSYATAPGGGSSVALAGEANPSSVGPGAGGVPAGLTTGPTVNVAATTGGTPKGAPGTGGTIGTAGTHVATSGVTATSGGAGGAGSADTSGGYGLGGGGGPGGYGGSCTTSGSTPGSGGAGGAGGFPGGGGGGGGAVGGNTGAPITSVKTGAGGPGGAGVVVVVSYF